VAAACSHGQHFVSASVSDISTFPLKSATGKNADVAVPAASDDGFVAVVGKKKKALSGKEAPTSVAQPPHRNRIPLIGVRSVSTLPIIAKRPRTKSLFVSQFSKICSGTT
jgi:hypothetical protein